MQRDSLSESPYQMSNRHGRSASLSGDYHHSTPKQAMRCPPRVRPEPQFIAATAAAQIVTADQGLNALDSPTGTGGALVAPAPLALLNGFLDNMLFNILLSAKSTKLSAIRPALSDVLKPRLAKEVIAAADDELSEYLGGSDDDELSDFHGGNEPPGDFELERSWKLTRLRCMVYTRLGDMEEEDEDEHLRREGLDEDSMGPGRFSSRIGHITPAAAIFLTSILEYIGEHALILSGDAARTRISMARSRSPQHEQSDASWDQFQRLVVEEMDMEKLALNSTLGRLWRTWRKNVRAPMLSRTLSRESMLRRSYLSAKTRSRQSSIGTIDEPSVRGLSPQPPLSEDAELVDPADIPLPLLDNDIDEIEVPGFTAELAVAVPARSFRPRSLFLSGSELSTPTTPEGTSPILGLKRGENDVRSHTRSYSLPNAASIVSPTSTPSTDTGSAATLQGDHDQLPTMPEDDEPTSTSKEDILQPTISFPHPETHHTVQDQTGDDNDSRSEQTGSLRSTPRSHSSAHGRPTNGPKSTRYPVKRVDCHEDTTTHTIPQTSVEPSLPRKSSARKRPSLDSQTAVGDRKPRPVEGNIPTHRDAFREDDYASCALQPSKGEESQKSTPGPQSSIVETSFVAKPIQPPSQPPRLTPLRDLVKTASSAPSTPHGDPSPGAADSLSLSGESEKSHRPSIKSHSNSKSSSISGNTTPRYATQILPAGIERAAVQRVALTPSTPRDMTPKPRRSESISSYRDKRPITSGSSTSQVSSKFKGLVGWQAIDDRQVPLPTRTSSETNGRQSRTNDSLSDPSDLEQLIQSDETIHFTLTPRNMREMEDPNSPRWAPTRTDSSGMPDDAKSAPSHVGESLHDGIEDASGHNMNGLRIYSSSSTLSSKTKEAATPTLAKQTPQKKLAYQAREARVVPDSVKDFADFIRSTGPIAEENNKVPLHSATRPSGLSNGGRRPSAFTQASGPGSPKSMDSAAQSTMSQRSRPRLEARAAVVAKDDRTADLIDFIREGPPSHESHRIPRTVAPFRSTMDSEEFQAYSPVRAEHKTLTQGSVTSLQGSSAMNKSLPSSYNSRTGLLESTNRANNQMYGSRASSAASPMHGSSNGGQLPVRKQRRVRDPYAIDTDSEDEFEALDSIRAPKEESLADFLRNAPPPPTLDQPPQLLSINAHAARPLQAAKPRSKSTASSMKSRLMRTTSMDKRPSSKLSRSSLRSHRSTATSPPTGVPNIPPLPLHDNSLPKFSGGSPQLDNYVSHIGAQRNGGASPLARSPLESPGAQRYGRETGTAALADFFRNTGPATPSGLHSSASSFNMENEKGSNSFSRMFMRRKKQLI
ncbi:hypothetical protein AJ80_03495 [Polytolypa hystricis UAMH7299]|uniref:Uncharacterized protein n=1 Tax=Polytolypa hystricis (strain UAMH7299) TaxID=1447883 RepID=A0A2B7YHH0_POLH7|nr:hypothetical protein AJ80_03495 [Polytolypa hystricis UAMH7299]